jgi:hypothetical protein
MVNADTLLQHRQQWLCFTLGSRFPIVYYPLQFNSFGSPAVSQKRLAATSITKSFLVERPAQPWVTSRMRKVGQGLEDNPLFLFLTFFF